MQHADQANDDSRSENDPGAPVLGELTRRDALKGLAALSAALYGARRASALRYAGQAAPAHSTLTFAELVHKSAPDHEVAPGYDARVLVRWGDPIVAGGSEFEPGKAGREAQEKQFGFNNDFIAFLPLPRGSSSSDHGLLCVNHEYTWIHLMAPGLTIDGAMETMTREHFELEQAAHGHSVVEIEKRNGRWSLTEEKKHNRRITALTRCNVSGPAAGHARLKTKADPTGKVVTGTLNNCAGGVTPWGTVLVCEENFNKYFHGTTDDAREAPIHKRYKVGGELEFAWHRFDERFEVAKEPHEANRFGWVVEYDPYDPTSEPVKRTALGRLKHEGATCAVNHDGRVVVYMGDDERFEHLYKFVSALPWKPNDPKHNKDLLDTGTLYVARFGAGEVLTWIPLAHGEGPLTKENGFESQADVVIEARRAATLHGATPMDRPEDVETNPVTGKVYVMLTNNSERTKEQTDAANPRKKNKHGHVLELSPPKTEKGERDHAAERCTWEIFLLAGDPSDEKVDAKYHRATSASGWLTCPDNCAFDPQGRLWIATDGAPKSGFCDGIYACDTQGEGRKLTRFFFRGPLGCEICGPCFTPDGKTLFVSVQHPGETDEKDDPKPCSFATPSTRWPDFKPGVPPRPSVIAITKQDGGAIGG